MTNKISFFTLLFLWLCIIGQNGSSLFFGDINLIDHGQYAAWINHALHGKELYSHVFIQYGPLMVFPYLLFAKLFGVNMFSFRLWDTLSVFLGFVIFFYATAQLKITKILRVFLFISIIVVPGVSLRYWIGVLGLLALVKAFRKNSVILFFTTGLILSLCLLYSSDIFIFLLATILIYLFGRLVLVVKLMNEIFSILYLFSGFIVGVGGFYILTSNYDLFGHYLNNLIEFTNAMSGINIPAGQGLPDLKIMEFSIFRPFDLLKLLLSKNALFYWSFIILSISFFIGLLKLSSRKVINSDVFVFLLSFYAIFIYYGILGRSGHYFAVVPFVFLISTYFISTFISTAKSKKNSTRLIALSFYALLMLFMLRHISIFRYNLLPDIGNLSWTQVERIWPLHVSNQQVRQIGDLQRYFKKISIKNDSIYVITNTPALYFLLDRTNSTQYDLPLLAGNVDKRMLIVNQLLLKKPQYILEDSQSWAVDGVSDKERMPEVYKFVKENYKINKKIYQYIIYEKK